MTAVQLTARELFRAAYNNRYTWDHQFPGYTATVTYHQGDDVFTGAVKVTADLKAEVTGIEDEAAQKAVHGQLWEIAVHRVRRSFDETHANNEFSFGETDESGAVEILVKGKAMGDRYKIKDDTVTLVHRHIHGVVVTINTLSTHDTGAGYLSHRYDSVYHDPSSGEQKGGVSLFEDNYEQVGDYWILNERTVETKADGAVHTQRFVFSDIQLS